MENEGSYAALGLKVWKAQIERSDKLFGSLSSEEVLREIASGRDRPARMGPIAGICRSNLMAGCFRASANSSEGTGTQLHHDNSAKASNCW